VVLFVVLIVQASIGGTWLPGAVVVLSTCVLVAQPQRASEKAADWPCRDAYGGSVLGVGRSVGLPEHAAVPGAVHDAAIRARRAHVAITRSVAAGTCGVLAQTVVRTKYWLSWRHVGTRRREPCVGRWAPSCACT